MAERPPPPVLPPSPSGDASPASGEQENLQEASFRENFRQIRELGQGAQGKAILVQHKATGNKYVLKQIPLSRLPNRHVDPALSEVEVLSRLSHQNITRLNGAWRTRDSINILMEYADGGSLADVLNARKESNNLLDEDVLLDWFVQIVGALRAMHEEHILHRDLKAANVFLTARNIIKVGDFGISKVLDSAAELAQTAVGTPYYLAPEVVNGEAYGFKADTWSLGVLLYELMTLRKPFQARSLPQLVAAIMKCQYPPPSDAFSTDLRTLLDSLLQRDPARRPTIEQLWQHPLCWQHAARLQAQLRSLALLATPTSSKQHTAAAPPATAQTRNLGRSSVSGNAAETPCPPRPSHGSPCVSHSPRLSQLISPPGAGGTSAPPHGSRLSRGSKEARAAACGLRMRMSTAPGSLLGLRNAQSAETAAAAAHHSSVFHDVEDASTTACVAARGAEAPTHAGVSPVPMPPHSVRKSVATLGDTPEQPSEPEPPSSISGGFEHENCLEDNLRFSQNLQALELNLAALESGSTAPVLRERGPLRWSSALQVNVRPPPSPFGKDTAPALKTPTSDASGSSSRDRLVRWGMQ